MIKLSNILLTLIMESKVNSHFIDGQWIGIQYDDSANECLARTISMCEFINKSKAWLLTRIGEFEINYSKFFITLAWEFGEDGMPLNSFSADTEQEVIIKACQWILENEK